MPVLSLTHCSQIAELAWCSGHRPSADLGALHPSRPWYRGAKVPTWVPHNPVLVYKKKKKNNKTKHALPETRLENRNGHKTQSSLTDKLREVGKKGEGDGNKRQNDNGRKI